MLSSCCQMVYWTAACFARLVNTCRVLSVCVWACSSAAEIAVICTEKAPSVQFECLRQISNYLVVSLAFLESTYLVDTVSVKESETLSQVTNIQNPCEF